MGRKNDLAPKLAISLFFFVLIYFAFRGITTTPEQLREIDSLTYHIPIAQSIAKGKLLRPPDLPHGLGYYPSVGESILAGFIIFGIPLNLFNVLGLILLFLVSVLTAERFGLNRASSMVFATTVCLLNSVLRLSNGQTIDIWLAVFFLIALFLLQRRRKSNLYFAKLGVVFGLLIGVKYSGVLFAFVLMIFYGRKIIPLLNPKRVLVFIFPFLIFGISWYLRNYGLTDNPIYPGSILGLPKHPDFRIQEWYPIETILYFKGGPWLLAQALVSEYLIWSLSLMVLPILFLFSRLKSGIQIDNDTKTLVRLGLVNFLVFLFLPSWPGAIYSDVRYLFPSIIPLILATFLLAKRYKAVEQIHLVALLNSMAVLPQLHYHPKLIILWLSLISTLLLSFSKV